MNTSLRRALLVAPTASALTVCGFTGALAVDPAPNAASLVTPVAATAAAPQSTAAPAANPGRGSDGTIPGNGHHGNGTQGNGGHGSDGTIPGNGTEGNGTQDNGTEGNEDPAPTPVSPDPLPETPTPQDGPTPQPASPVVPISAPLPADTLDRPDRPVLVTEPGTVAVGPLSLPRTTVVETTTTEVRTDATTTTVTDVGTGLSAAAAPGTTSALPESLAYTGVHGEILGAGGLGALLLAVGAALRLRRS